MLYDVPGRTATRIQEETYEAARELENVVAVKDATGDLPGAARLVDLGYAVYSGDDVDPGIPRLWRRGDGERGRPRAGRRCAR